MGDRPDGFLVGEAASQTLEHHFEDAPLCLDCGMRCLVQNSAHVLVALGGLGAVRCAGADVVSRTYPNPRGKLLRGRKNRDGGADLGDDPLCRIRPRSWRLRQPSYRILMLRQQGGRLLVEFLNLYTGFSSRAARSASHSCACVARSFRSAASAIAAGSVCPSAGACSMRRPLCPNKSETKLDSVVSCRERRARSRYFMQGCVAAVIPGQERRRPFIRSKRTLRIQQGSGFDTSTDTSILSLSVPFSVPASLEYLHGLSRAGSPRPTGHGFRRAAKCRSLSALAAARSLVEPFPGASRNTVHLA